MAVAVLLGEALRTTGSRAVPEPRQALDAALDPRTGGVCIAISHDGTTRRRSTRSPPRAVRGGDRDDRRPRRLADRGRLGSSGDAAPRPSWCHTVAYASTILAGAAIAREIGEAGQDSSPIVETLALRPQIDSSPHGSREPADPRGRARRRSRHGPRAALKIEEGARVARRTAARVAPPRTPRAVATPQRTGLVLFAADPLPPRSARRPAGGRRGPARAIGIRPPRSGARPRSRAFRPASNAPLPTGGTVARVRC